MAAGLFISYLRNRFRGFKSPFSDSDNWPAVGPAPATGMPVQVCPATNDQIDIPSGRVDLGSPTPSPSRQQREQRPADHLADGQTFLCGVLPDPLNQAAWKFHCECQFRFAGWNRRLQLL